MRRIFLAAALAVLVLFSGCVSQNISHEQRMLCIDLSSQAHADVPECRTQESCYVELEKFLFDFFPAGFSSESESLFLQLKNDVSLSWLYFNRAKENAEEIHEVCLSDKGYETLPKNINEFNSNLLNAFKFSDLGHSKAFAMTAIDVAFLEEQDINLVKEEQLYDVFLSLNQNLLDLESRSTTGKSFASLYIARFERFHNSSFFPGSGPVFVKESTILDLLGKFDSHIAKQVDLGDFWMPVFSVLFSDIIERVIDSEKRGNAVLALKNMPSFELMQAYSGFVGLNNSSMNLFSVLLEKRSVSFAETEAGNSELSSKIPVLFSEIDSKISSVSGNQFSFESSFIEALYSDLNQVSSLSVQKYSISDLRDFSGSAGASLLALEQEFSELKTMEELSQISLGKRTSRLKEIYGESLELGENIDYLEEEVLQGLLVLCDNRVSEISSFVKENKLELQGIFHVEDLQSSLSYRLALFEKASSRDEKLLHCKTALEQFTDLKQAVRDYEQYSLNASEKIDSCFAEVEKILSNPSLAGLDLLDFREQFLLLKQLEKPYAVESVSRQCSSLLERLSVFAGSSETVYEAEKSFSELESFYKDFVSVQEHLSIFSKNTLKTIEKSFSSIAKFFDEGKLRISNATDLGSLNKEIQELEKFIEGEFSESVLKSFSESAQWVYDGNKTRLVLENNVYGLNRPVIVEIPLKAKGQITGISSNISKAFVRNALLFLDLNYVPLGPTIIEFEELSEDSNTPAQEPVVILQDETENNEASRLSSEEFSQKLQRLYLLRDSLIPENLDFFRDIFLSTTPEEMIDAKYIPPLSEDRISKIETELSTIVPLSLAKKLSDFERAFNEKDYDSAMEIAVSTEAELESKLALLESRKKELSIAVDSVKEEALASFNSAASEFNKGEHSPETEKKLEEAEKSLKEGDFINSILFSRNATALMSVPDSSDLSIPVAVIPIIVAAIAIAFIRLKRKKDNEKRKSLVKRVLQNW